MANGVNAAYRLANVLRRVTEFADNTPALGGWARIFDLEKLEKIEQEFAVAERLVWMRGELRSLMAQLPANRAKERVAQDVQGKVLYAISPLRLAGEWTHVRRHVTEGVTVALDLWADFLPADEQALSQEHIDSLKGLILDLLDTAEGPPELPIQLESLIRHHAEIIRQALDEYQIVGAKALWRAKVMVAEDVYANAEVLKENRDSEAVGVLRRAWKTFSDVIEVASKFEKVLRLGKDIYEFLPKD